VEVRVTRPGIDVQSRKVYSLKTTR
jgi:hypothetical protein